MTALTNARATEPPRRMALNAHLALVVADATWYTTADLFSAVDRPQVGTLLLSCLDYRNAFQRGWWPWTWRRPTRQLRDRLWERQLILPTGWMKTFPRFGMRPIARSVERWRAGIEPSGELVLVITYPHYLHLRDQIRPDRTVYFNIDDYSHYWPHRAKSVRALERRAVREADLTVCVSKVRCQELQATVANAGPIHYLPHGCPGWGLAESPQARPAEPPIDLSVVHGPRLGYVGSLEDRVDWNLLDRLATELPDASLVFVGKPSRDGHEPWHGTRARCLSRPNVRVLGWKPQSEIAHYIRAFDVCLIPYRVDHPFNRVCNPTKIMDYMGSGRPIVSTALPECRLHAERFDVVASDGEFIERVRAIATAGGDDGRAALRHDFALHNSCAHTAERLLRWLGH
jgi:glycosyltransferase involved in cell wall biosynthesis